MLRWPYGDGEMPGRVRDHDWGSTPLGPIDHWPETWKTAVQLVLGSGQAMQLALGPAQVMVYNDAYVPMLGARHPQALGMPLREAWSDVWLDIEPLVGRVFAGETVMFDDMPLHMTRRGYPEETWWSFSYSPVRDHSGDVTGLLNVTTETTLAHRTEQAEQERDVAVNRLRNNEARFRALVTAGVNTVYRMSPDWGEMYELDSQTLANTTAPVEDWVSTYIPVEDQPDVREAIDRAIDNKSLFEFEHRVRQADGQVGWVLSRAVPLLGPNGEIVEWFGAASDVGARRLAIEGLQRSEERYRQLFMDAERRAAELVAVIESIGDAVYMGDASGITLSNRATLEQLGYASSDELSRRIGHLASETQMRDAETGDAIDENDHPFSRALRGERVTQNVRLRRRTTGDELIVRSSAAPVVSRGGILGAVAINTDITSIMRTEEALRESEDLQKFLLMLSDAMRPLLDTEEIKKLAATLLGKYLAVNRAFYASAQASNDFWLVAEGFEHDVASLPRQPFAMSAYGNWIVDGFRAGRALVVDDMVQDARFEVSERDAHLTLQIRAQIAAPLFKNDRLVAMLVVQSVVPRHWSSREVALLENASERVWSAVERARSEAALLLADRRKDEFLAVLAHELRNGLAPVVYNAEIGNRSPGDAALLKQLSERSSRQLRHVMRLVDDLLDVSRINTGKIELSLEVLKVREIVNQSIEACRSEADRKHHRLVVIDETDVDLTVLADRVRLTQVLSNLLSNATKYMDTGGTITIRIASVDEQVVVEISDKGIGIPAAALSRVFDLFTQVRNQQSYSAGGLGIGLSLVKQLVEMHGGHVEAASDGPGHGSRFTVILPTGNPNSERALGDGPLSSTVGGVRSLRVLVVDDQQDSADALSQWLRLQGHDAEAAYSGAEALAQSRSFPPDVVLLDLGMPGMDGFEVARRLRHEVPGGSSIQIVALTGWGQEADRQKTKAASFDAHLAKPASGTDLQAVLAAASRSLS